MVESSDAQMMSNVVTIDDTVFLPVVVVVTRRRVRPFMAALEVGSSVPNSQVVPLPRLLALN